TYAVIITAALVAATILALSRSPSPAAVRAPPRITPARLEGTAPSDCANCHAREVAQWSRSVMAHAAKSPLFGALDSLVEEEVGRDDACPNGAGILRKTASDACRDEKSGITVTGAGGEHWCVSCHAPGENLGASMPAWSALGAARARQPVRDLLSTT